MDSGVLDIAENMRHFGEMTIKNRKNGFDETQKNSPVLEVKVTSHLYQYGIEIKIGSMKNDGSHSWIVISRCMNEHVELPEENGKSVHCEEMVTGTGRPVATEQKEQSNPRLLSFSKMFVPIDQRKWKDILAVDYVDEGSLSFSVLKTTTRILRR